MPSAELKYWQELLGMPGGPVRTPCLEMTDEDKAAMYADLKATGILDRVRPALKAA
jgi:4-hydroxy-tetrahydrodipicolinate synthase